MKTTIKIEIRNHLNRREINIVEIYIRELLTKEPFEYIVDNVEGFKTFSTENELNLEIEN